jgi:hypothetical protein
LTSIVGARTTSAMFLARAPFLDGTARSLLEKIARGFFVKLNERQKIALTGI